MASAPSAVSVGFIAARFVARLVTVVPAHAAFAPGAIVSVVLVGILAVLVSRAVAARLGIVFPFVGIRLFAGHVIADAVVDVFVVLVRDAGHLVLQSARISSWLCSALTSSSRLP